MRVEVELIVKTEIEVDATEYPDHFTVRDVLKDLNDAMVRGDFGLRELTKGAITPTKGVRITRVVLRANERSVESSLDEEE